MQAFSTDLLFKAKPFGIYNSLHFCVSSYFRFGSCSDGFEFDIALG